MKINIKTGNCSYTVEVEDECTIEGLGKALAAAHNLPAADLSRLVYRGRILKGPVTQTLSSQGISDGATIYMLKTAASANPAAASASSTTGGNNNTQQNTSTTATAPSTSVGSNNVVGGGSSSGNPAVDAANPFAAFLGGANPGAAGADPFAALAGSMNPSSISSLMQNPMAFQLMQDMLSNPELMRNMMQSQPMIQNLAQSNPIFQQLLQDPVLFQQAFSPQAMQAVQQFFANRPGGGAPGGAAPGGMPDLSALLGGAGGAAAGGAPPQMPDFASLLLGAGGAGAGATRPGAAGGAPTMANLMEAMGIRPDEGLESNETLRNFTEMLGSRNMEGLLSNPNASEQFSEQLKSLEDMGFLERDANLQALIRSRGDVNGAINLLLEQGFGN